MTRHLETTILTYPISGVFTISRGSRTEAQVIVCTISDRGVTGRGECVPYRRYGETLASVEEEILAQRDFIADGGSRHELVKRMKPGAARNAIDCAFWDLESKLAGVPVARATFDASAFFWGDEGCIEGRRSCWRSRSASVRSPPRSSPATGIAWRSPAMPRGSSP